MNISVLGTGTAGRTLAAALAGHGHHLVMGTRDPEGTLARTAPDQHATFAGWQTDHKTIRLTGYADAAADGEIIVNATNGLHSVAALTAAGAGNLAGKILIDIANPLDFSHGMPPSLDPVNTDSLAEQIQRTFPEAKVVKTLNTMSAAVMVNPRSVAGGEHSVFVSGNDARAKATVAALLEVLGHRDVIDLGDITTARGTEMLLPVWLQLWGSLGTMAFNFKIAR
ncbi:MULTISPECIES: NADPH-dependent F420 reductase [Arthrobacter]|uniref:NADP oxidoreductase n=1 Tax=Arthrobacter oryzae TaxID=409290 RepID=A0A3N0BNJ2_9MICC|nr:MULTISPECIES: NAD(P)-binding domain-containing protein [Arthrobacter]QYF88574.1 NAD(P)-binding domain-containing protein [Arthrobacter sp. PAMC25284]RNL50092.1 NADP oxidoreductase [Arthrobacter oryzae]